MSMHCLDRMYERMHRKNQDEGSRKDTIEAISPSCLYSMCHNTILESIKLSDGSDGVSVKIQFSKGDQQYFGSLPHKLAYEILHQPYDFRFLVGYCPIGFCNNDDEFIHLKTFLTPGMKGTPEKELLNNIEDKKQKIKYKGWLEDNEIISDHFEMYKYFQTSGCLVVDYIPKEK